MNSRERVLATIEHREPDRIPIDLGGTPSSGISALAYTNLKEYLKIKTGHTQVYDVVQQLAQPEEDFLARFHVDVVDIGRTFNASEGDWYPIQIHGKELHYPQWFKPRRNLDGSYDVLDREADIIAHMPANGYFFDQSYYPYREGYPADFRDLPKVMTKILWQTLAHSPWDHAGDPKFWDTLRSRAISLRKSSNRAIMIACGCNLFEWGTFLRGLDHFLVDLVKQPAQVERLLDALMEQHLASLEKVCKAVGDVVDILRFGDDLGTNDRSFMRPEIYRRLFKPRHTILCQ
jgi:uroporphyrinogen decarboxylase